MAAQIQAFEATMIAAWQDYRTEVARQMNELRDEAKKWRADVQMWQDGYLALEQDNLRLRQEMQAGTELSKKPPQREKENVNVA